MLEMLRARTVGGKASRGVAAQSRRVAETRSNDVGGQHSDDDGRWVVCKGREVGKVDWIETGLDWTYYGRHLSVP